MKAFLFGLLMVCIAERLCQHRGQPAALAANENINICWARGMCCR